ncbi:MAG: orotidine-5'-phosphate decarboxylase [Bacteroidia bacterium]|jgi:orotidine-5'-phosphate decarboxylase|nr:orotidine-5'-phosphate decarboxylase [Bacteroidia bacterium]
MTREDLIEQIRLKKSYLCVGLDTDPDKLPSHILKEEDPVFAFNKQIIDATKDFCVAYKPNIAFYEALGTAGWESLRKTLAYIPDTHFTIADAKRGDIGNTSAMYAQTFFNRYPFDAVTVAPYMGRDSIEPFLAYAGKWAIVLGLTSNPGAGDFEQLLLSNGMRLFEQVLQTVAGWGSTENLMFVAGATRPEGLRQVRAVIPEHFLLIPGVGAQGGSLEAVSEAALNDDIGILVNASRSILYASSGVDFADRAFEEAASMQKAMSAFIG